MIKVLLVDDHKIIRDGIKALINDSDHISICGECNNGLEVQEFIKHTEADIILMDVSMPEKNGIEATEEIIKDFPDMKILALTMHNQESYISKILKAGASGYVLKSTGEDELIKAIETIHSGETYFSSEVSEIMMAKFMKKPASGYQYQTIVSVEDLTTREREIIGLIADELTNNEIAEKLFISPRTVDTHRRNLLQKLGVKNTAGLVKFAIHHKLSD